MFTFDAGLAITVFIATDIDDLLLLAALFADSRLSHRAIVGGQFAGIAVLVLVSLLAALLAVTIPAGWLALLGIVPFGMGLVALRNLRADTDDDDAEEALAAVHQAGRKPHLQWLAVASLTIANGGDNLGAYIPLFSRNPDGLVVYIVIFGTMTALWCALAWWLVRHPRSGKLVGRYGELLLPFVLIALGLLILADVRLLFA